MKDIREHMRIIASIVPDFDTLLDWQKINLILDGNFGKTPNYPVVRDMFNLEAATRTYVFSVTHVYICIYVISMVLFFKHMHQLSALN